MLVEGSLAFVVELVRISHFSDYSNGNLSGNIELFTQSSVSEFMEVKLAEGLMRPRYARALTSSCIGSLKRLFQCGSLLFGRIQFQSYRQFHGTNNTTLRSILEEIAVLSRASQNSSHSKLAQMARYGWSILLRFR